MPQPYIIPLPPTIEPNFELGLRYWASEGDTNRVTANGGLHYDSVDGNSGEFVFRAQNAAQFFGKGFVGGGGLSGGTLEGSDSQVGLAATTSRAGDGSLVYGTIDVGKRFDIVESGPRFSVSPFIGLNIFQDKISAFGAAGVSSSTNGATRSKRRPVTTSERIGRPAPASAIGNAEVTDGDTRVRSETREINLDEFSTTRLGVYGEVSYRF